MEADDPKRLQKQIRVLEKRLQRSERSRAELERFREKNQRMLMVVNSDIEESAREIERQNRELLRLNEELETERQKVDLLLHNVLPASVVAELKETGRNVPRRFESAAMLFSDLVGFTPLSEKVDAGEMVGFLDGLFAEFDALAEAHGVEKIKTAGDAYMVAAGVPEPSPDHAGAVAGFGLAMLETVEGRELSGFPIRVRVGMAVGPVVGALVGRKRFLYDVWGDAVNVAARMESSGSPGRLQVDTNTAEILAGRFALEERGVVDIKGKGPMRTFWLNGRLDTP